MKIHIQNLGSIKEFAFELKKGLTIFCGPNNTGKTYAAYAVYSILSGFKKRMPEWLSAEDFQRLLENDRLSIDLLQRGNSATFFDEINRQLKDNLRGDFDAPSDFFSQCAVQIELPSALPPTRFADEKSTFAIAGRTFDIVIARGVLTLVCASTLDQGKPALPAETIRPLLNRLVSNLYAKQFLNRVFVMSSERSAINLFSRELSLSRNDLVDKLLSVKDMPRASDFDYVNFLDKRASRYSLPIRDGLEIAEDLISVSKQHGELADLAKQLESDILGGAIGIGENGELIYSPMDAASIRMHLTGSLVKSLASLLVYLRHQSKVGDLLIIDEPEMNLHPDNQRLIARFLCQLVNAGIDIVISTHSDYIIREINNAIVLRDPKFNAIRTRHGYKECELLAPEQVSVVLFGKNGLPVDIDVGELGFSVESIDEVINALNQIADEILMEMNK